MVLMGEMLSGIDSEAVVHVPRGGCTTRGPVELDQNPLSKASERLCSCLAKPPTPAALSLQSERRRSWGDAKRDGAGAHPANYVAAECIKPDFDLPEADR
ncbi:MAG TPA: hypothetical protein VGK73_11690 [Polyangiaceae bacterium]